MGLIAHVKHPPENKNELHESYLKIPPEVFIRRKMGANVSMDAGELSQSSMVLGTAAEKTPSVHRRSAKSPDFLCSLLGGCDLPKSAGARNDGVS